MTTFYGVEYSTDSREHEPREIVQFRSELKARGWRRERGPAGVGEAFSRDNGHRLIRVVYRMPSGWRKPGKVQLADAAFSTARPSIKAALWSAIRRDGDEVRLP